MKKLVVVLSVVLALNGFLFANGQKESGTSDEPVTLEFMQWWADEMTPGTMDSVIADFEAANPDIKIKVITKPYSDVENQVTIAAASGTLSDVMGLNPKWAYDLSKSNSIMPLDGFFEAEDYPVDKHSITKVNDDSVVMLLEAFIYPLFYNVDMFEAAGITEAPTNYTEFEEACAKLYLPKQDQYPLTVGFSMQNPGNIQNDLLSWMYSCGYDVFPTINTEGNKEIVGYYKGLYDQGFMTPSALVNAEQDKIELFVNERAAMMVDSLAHINMIHERNPDINFDICPVPVPDDYTGKQNFYCAGWGIGISNTTEYPEQAWKFVKYMESAEVAARIADSVNAFPANSDSVVTWVEGNELNKKAFNYYKDMGVMNQSWGAPRANNLLMIFLENFQDLLMGNIDLDTSMSNTQAGWDEIYADAAK